MCACPKAKLTLQPIANYCLAEWTSDISVSLWKGKLTET